MTIELNGISFQIIADANQPGIFVHNTSPNKLSVYTHPSTPHHELVAFLEAYLRRPSRRQNPTITPVSEIDLFGRRYTVIIDPVAKTPRIYGTTIRIAKYSTASIPKIKKELFRHALQQQIGAWEERLHVLVDKIEIRKLPKNPFTVRTLGNIIVFDAKLTHQSLSLIGYVVARALFEFAQIPEERQERLLEQHLSDWKQNKRIIAFEYGT